MRALPVTLAERVVALVARHGPVSQGWLRRALRGPSERMVARGIVATALREAVAAGLLTCRERIDGRGVPKVTYETARPAQVHTAPARGHAAAERAARVQQLLAERGPMTVAELAAAFACSATTIRRALKVAETLGVERLTGAPARWGLAAQPRPAPTRRLGRAELTEPDFGLLGAT